MGEGSYTRSSHPAPYYSLSGSCYLNVSAHSRDATETVCKELSSILLQGHISTALEGSQGERRGWRLDHEGRMGILRFIFQNHLKTTNFATECTQRVCMIRTSSWFYSYLDNVSVKVAKRKPKYNIGMLCALVRLPLVSRV